MSDREKLIEILSVPIYPHLDADPVEVVADYLIDNGVTMQKWIPVSERLPEPNEDGSVNAVLVTNGFVRHMAYFNNKNWWFCESGEAAELMFYVVTHWMPLPEPPKECE